ncbi:MULTISPECIES: hypothetical protein [Nostoc]|uniref:Uncharacterized protein n=1 Tax=Nostoc paludosum FACHB-159 TaxID=2692908 RepID=A0ABR8KII3_9NOSO|nr:MULTISPECIES: hypothetical protein [Nostoc]MBD2681740.1 hypothetical protein [Nostoc sp. FACHB-857]MBD2738105.1 hypothetical protein [Nostoc paludosum FACHB-159]
MFDEENPLTQAAQLQMERHLYAGWEAYANLQRIRAAEIFGKALKIAESINDNRNIVLFRFWRGECLFRANKLNQALDVIVPTMKEENTEAGTADIFKLFTLYIEVAYNLPVSLESIKKAYQRTENFLYNSGNQNWRHRLLWLQAQLYPGLFHSKKLLKCV